MIKSKNIAFLSMLSVLSFSTLLGQVKQPAEKKQTRPAKEDQNYVGRPIQGHPYVLVEGKAGYFFPAASRFKDIYGGNGIYGYEASCEAYDGLYAWTSGSYFSKSGHSKGLYNSTRLKFVPIGAGLKYLYKVNILDFYVGIGGLATYAHIHDRSSYVKQKIHKWGGGVILKGGILVNLPYRFFFDIYGDYSFQWVPYHGHNGNTITPHNADLSGGSVGGGFGYRF